MLAIVGVGWKVLIEWKRNWRRCGVVDRGLSGTEVPISQ
jgi:hypothetical protein